LFPTRYEPFSNVVLEAMSFENAVFTTRQNGAHEILTDEYIMASSKDFSVAKKIDDLLEDAKELSDIKRENKLIASKLSIELNMQKTIEVINKV
jgi:UDP-glucose:(heptosyl)LPS alpha-1,3-glucosyltransferase